jgi:hypothetical protein
MRRTAAVLCALLLGPIPALASSGPAPRPPSVTATHNPAPKASPVASRTSTASPSAARRRPVINVTATTYEPRRAQIRLAAFIHSVQTGNWARATTYLSRQVNATERRQMLTGAWLRPKRRDDFSVLLYMPRIEIRTVSIAPSRARLRVLPLTWEKTAGQPIGVWEVMMLRENNRWMLNIHP